MGQKLDAINRLLIAKGVAPTTDEDSGHPDVAKARTLLEAHKKNVQSRKLWYNTETDTLSPDSYGKISVPTYVIALDDEGGNIIVDGKLYNIEDRTNVFTDDVEDVVMIFNRPWDYIPEQAWEYIVALAKEEFIRSLRDELISTLANNDITRAKALLDITDYRFKDPAKETGNPLMQKWRTKMLVR